MELNYNINKKVSIITPVYNSEKFLENMIQSVIDQTYKNWELILVDDCSNDNSKKIINNYIILDSRIKYYRLKENSGAAVARNYALEKSTGRFIAYLDSDDLWKPTKLEKQIKFMQSNQYGFSCSDYEVIDESGNPKNKIINMPRVISYKLYLKNTIIQTVGVVIDTSIINKELLKMPIIRRRQDAATWCKILKNGFNCYGLNENLCSYRRVSNSLSSNKLKAMKGTWHLYRKIEKLPLYEAIFNFIGYAWNACKKRIYIKNHIIIKNPKIEVAVSTMNLENPIEFVKKMNIQTDAIIINQCTKNTYQELNYNGNKIRIFSYNEKGLSKSRNRGLENIANDTDIVLIADDKVKYMDGYEYIVKKAYMKNKKADIIAFNVVRNGNDGRVTKKLPRKIGYITSFRVFSVRITFNINSIRSKNIKFDENFGTGTKLYLGEDNIFITDCLKNKLKVYGENEVISRINPKGDSTWFRGIDEKFLFVKGCCFRRIFGSMCHIYILDFAIRKYREYKKKVSFFDAINILLQGSKKYNEF